MSKKAIKKSESAGSRPHREARQQLTPEQKQAMWEMPMDELLKIARGEK